MEKQITTFYILVVVFSFSPSALAVRLAWTWATFQLWPIRDDQLYQMSKQKRHWTKKSQQPKETKKTKKKHMLPYMAEQGPYHYCFAIVVVGVGGVISL